MSRNESKNFSLSKQTIDFLNMSKENIAKYPEDFTWPTIPDENQCIVDILTDDFPYDTDQDNVNRQRNNQNDCSNLLFIIVK